jgi:hypothetical protein
LIQQSFNLAFWDSLNNSSVFNLKATNFFDIKMKTRMKNPIISIMKLFTYSFVGIMLLSNCDKETITNVASNCENYYVTNVLKESQDLGTRHRSIKIYTKDGANFTEDINVTVNYSNASSEVVKVVSGASTPQVLDQFSVFLFDKRIASVYIVSESCPSGLEKTEEDIKKDTDELACELQDDLTIIEKRCGDTYQFSWEASGADLSGVKYVIYGQEIDLSNGTSKSFSENELDLEQNGGYLDENGRQCDIGVVVITCGITGILALSDPLEAGVVLTAILSDADLNTSPESAETVTVTVTSDKGESESIELTETGNNTGMFLGTLATANESAVGTNNDGTIHADDGTVLTVTYEDELDGDAGSTTVTATVTVEAPPATCDDGIQNGDEEGIDCGGTLCDACPTCDDGIQNGDETGVDCGGTCDACALADGEINFNGTVYTLNDNSSTFSPYTGGILFDMSTSGGSFAISIDIYSNTTVDSGTYTVDGDPEGISSVLSLVSTENGSNLYAITGGSATLTINGGSYTLEMDLTTEGGNMKGTYTFPE